MTKVPLGSRRVVYCSRLSVCEFDFVARVQFAYESPHGVIFDSDRAHNSVRTRKCRGVQGCIHRFGLRVHLRFAFGVSAAEPAFFTSAAILV
jgi:hypothetical protein